MTHALTIRRRASAAALALALATGLVVLGAAHRAGAAGDTITLAGPTSNAMGSDFNYTVSGTAAGPANTEISFEQFHKASGCSPTFGGEAARDFTANGTYEITYWGTAHASGAFSATDAFGARNLGVHGACAYLINAATGVTYAHAQAWWTNHN